MPAYHESLAMRTFAIVRVEISPKAGWFEHLRETPDCGAGRKRRQCASGGQRPAAVQAFFVEVVYENNTNFSLFLIYRFTPAHVNPDCEFACFRGLKRPSVLAQCLSMCLKTIEFRRDICCIPRIDTCVHVYRYMMCYTSKMSRGQMGVDDSHYSYSLNRDFLFTVS